MFDKVCAAYTYASEYLGLVLNLFLGLNKVRGANNAAESALH